MLIFPSQNGIWSLQDGCAVFRLRVSSVSVALPSTPGAVLRLSAPSISIVLKPASNPGCCTLLVRALRFHCSAALPFRCAVHRLPPSVSIALQPASNLGSSTPLIHPLSITLKPAFHMCIHKLTLTIRPHNLYPSRRITGWLTGTCSRYKKSYISFISPCTLSLIL